MKHNSQQRGPTDHYRPNRTRPMRSVRLRKPPGGPASHSWIENSAPCRYPPKQIGSQFALQGAAPDRRIHITNVWADCTSDVPNVASDEEAYRAGEGSTGDADFVIGLIKVGATPQWRPRGSGYTPRCVQWPALPNPAGGQPMQTCRGGSDNPGA